MANTQGPSPTTCRSGGQSLLQNVAYWGVWERFNGVLRERLRLKVDHEAEPSAGVLDRQSVKTIEAGSIKGYDGGKKIKGRRRHLLVDTQGLLLNKADPVVLP